MNEADGRKLFVDFLEAGDPYIKPATELKMFSVSENDNDDTPAFLVFAKTEIRASIIGRRKLLDWEKPYIEEITGKDYLYENADQEKLEKNIVHYVYPLCCGSCRVWSVRINFLGFCKECFENLSYEEITERI